jgi:asparagine synthase (glutamine-hydrolysing)
MHRLSGIWYFDSRPAGDSDTAWVLSGLGETKDWPGRLQRGPGLLMGQRGSGFAPAGNAGCAVGFDGSICTWDGRLDNREDLLLQLGIASATRPTDSALALRLHQIHGLEGFRDLIGDWSLVIADAASRVILLASDYAGIRPLYYCRTAECLMWSSSLSHLVHWSGRSQLDEEYVASFLTHGSAAFRTPYRGIYPTPPGRAVRISAEGVSTHAFWDLPVDREIRYKNPDCYREQLRSLFREAVAVRLPSNAPVCAELSGGLDSSSIVCMADSLAKERPSEIHRPTAFTYTHQGAADEKYAKAVERARNLASIRLDLEEYPFIAPHQAGNAAPSWWGPRLTELGRQCASMGAGAFLTGQLGDFVMGNTLDDSGQAADYLREGHWLDAGREAYRWSRALGVPLYPLLWRALRTAYSPWTASVESGATYLVSSSYAHVHSLASGFLKRVSRNRAESLPERAWRAARPGRRSRFRALSQILDARTLQAPEALQQISYSHPFAHRPLLEFMLTIPPAEVCRPGEPRWLMRRAFADFLPPAILQRRSKAAYADVYRKALTPLASTMLSQPDKIRLVTHGYADRQSVADRLTRFLQGLDCNESQLRQLLLFEFWLRNREGRPNSPAGHHPFLGTTTTIFDPRPGAASSTKVAPIPSARSRMPLIPQ